MGVAELSTALAWGATLAYVIALVAFAVDLSRLADRAARPRQRVVAGADGAASGVTDAASGAPRVVSDVPGVPTDGHLPAGADAGPGSDRRRSSGRAVGIAMSTTVLGLALHLAATVLRGVAAERVPWANMYEFTLVGTLVAVATFLILCLRRDVRFLGTIVVGLAVIALTVALDQFYVPAEAVEPALQSYWLVIHVSSATVATGLFTVSFAASVLQLLKDSREGGSQGRVAAWLSGPRWRLLDGLPGTRELEALSFRLAGVGFVLWTFILMTGAIWAEHAWGRYWGWDPKEVWSFVVWVVYAAYLHARTTRGWSGRRAAWFVLVGYATVIFNFTGVNLLFQGLHSYSGL